MAGPESLWGDPYKLLAAALKDDWWKKGKCVGNPHEEIFFSERLEHVALKFCETCPVKARCLDDAVLHKDDGVRGGTNMKYRKAIEIHRKRHLKAFEHDLGDLLG